jgi:hypothetical protein
MEIVLAGLLVFSVLFKSLFQSQLFCCVWLSWSFFVDLPLIPSCSDVMLRTQFPSFAWYSLYFLSYFRLWQNIFTSSSCCRWCSDAAGSVPAAAESSRTDEHPRLRLVIGGKLSGGGVTPNVRCVSWQKNWFCERIHIHWSDSCSVKAVDCSQHRCCLEICCAKQTDNLEKGDNASRITSKTFPHSIFIVSGLQFMTPP